MALPASALACPEDTDGDGFCDALDNCALVDNAPQADTDGDGLGDACDVCDGQTTTFGAEDGVEVRGEGRWCTAES